MTGRHFGDIPGVPVGTTFHDRRALSAAGVHRPPVAGISGAQDQGADSIVVSGGYEDDEDDGDIIIYTGQDGNNPSTLKQVADQTLTAGNLALAKSCTDGLPVRVIRGARGNPHQSPPTGYRYDGLYYVDAYWHEIGRSGYRIWRYRLIREPSQQAPAGRLGDPRTPYQPGEPVPRATFEVQREIRSTATMQTVKRLYNYACQLCGERIMTPAGPYAEGAHIRPLGRPHDGPDELQNILCLCPNDHVRFDYGQLRILDDLSILDSDGSLCGTLNEVPAHHISRQHLAYHREHFGDH